MSEAESTIRPTTPTAGYAPAPSSTSKDRDAEGEAVIRRENRNSRKSRKGKKPRTKPTTAPDEDSPEDPESANRVDIRAGAFQIEMREPCNLDHFSHRPGLTATQATQITIHDGTAIALSEFDEASDFGELDAYGTATVDAGRRGEEPRSGLSHWRVEAARPHTLSIAN